MMDKTKKRLKHKRRRKLDLKGIDLAALQAGSEMAAVELGLMEKPPEETGARRIFRTEQAFISR